MRDYGTGSWEGGSPDCDHKQGRDGAGRANGIVDERSQRNRDGASALTRQTCRCGATRQDQQLGLEATPDEYVARMVNVFREIRRVLVDHGTCWVNLGDSYAGSGPSGASYQSETTKRRAEGDGIDGNFRVSKRLAERGLTYADKKPVPPPGLKPKDLVGIPWRVAFALQADGWYLRSDIIWAKPNPMPESVTDRPTKAHEFIFLLTKAPWKGRVPGPIESALSPEDARWLALLLDAEGNICVKRVSQQERKSPQYAAQIAIGSTSRALLERVVEITGVGNINERAGTNAPMFYWQVSNKVAQDLLYAVYPHLIVKPRQARIAIYVESLLYHRGKATHRTDAENAALESLWQRNKECNQFGDPDLSDVPAPKYGKWGPSRYWFDAEAVREPVSPSTLADSRFGKPTARDLDMAAERYGEGTSASRRSGGSYFTPKVTPYGEVSGKAEGLGNGPRGSEAGRNVRSVWTIATQPYPEAHFATFPEELVRRCLLAGCPERVCVVCGKPSERIVERESVSRPDLPREHPEWRPSRYDAGKAGDPQSPGPGQRFSNVTTTGWTECDCTGESGHPMQDAVEKWRPGIVLDPFAGSGTTLHVARKHGRHAIGIELNADYCRLIADRTRQLSLLAT